MATTAEGFAQKAGAPDGYGLGDVSVADVPLSAPITSDGPLVVAIDAGHGGIDPGAQAEGVREADIVLALAFEVADAINRTGQMRAVLIRDADYFVPLEERMTRARAAGAAAFISLHADSLEMGGARGAAVYTLAKDAVDGASIRMAERHERGDLLATARFLKQGKRLMVTEVDVISAANNARVAHVTGSYSRP